LLPLLAEEHLPLVLGGIFSAALVSAILSTVDTTLLVVSSLVAHNLAGSLLPKQSERQKLLLARFGVVGAGIAACFMALGAQSVHGLVEEASAFGTAGIFVVFVFGVTTRFGGPASAYGALLAGVLVWVLASYLFEAETPFLLSLLGALLAYVLVALAVRSQKSTAVEPGSAEQSTPTEAQP
jgi:SSS family solute:Na+ symporter